MKEYQYRKQLLVLPWIEGEDLIVYGIRKVKENLKIVTIQEIINPEGAEWNFIYSERLNKLYIQKEGINLIYSGDISPEILEELKRIMKEKQIQ